MTSPIWQWLETFQHNWRSLILPGVVLLQPYALALPTGLAAASLELAFNK